MYSERYRALYPSRHQSQRPLAHYQDDRERSRNDERLVGVTRSLEFEDGMV